MSEKSKEEIWYPSKELVLEIHEIMLKKYGGWQGFENGINVFMYILEKAKAAKGTYLKAAIFLRDIVTGRIFTDGNHRVAQAVTLTFLEMNDLQMKIEDPEEIISFIKGILQYNYDEIAMWLEYGTTKRPEKSVS